MESTLESAARERGDLVVEVERYIFPFCEVLEVWSDIV